MWLTEGRQNPVNNNRTIPAARYTHTLESVTSNIHRLVSRDIICVSHRDIVRTLFNFMTLNLL